MQHQIDSVLKKARGLFGGGRVEPPPPPPLEAAPTSFPVGQPGLGGFIDSVQVDPSGLIRIMGWTTQEFNSEDAPRVRLDGEAVPFLQQFRFGRSDVSLTPGTLLPQAGLALDYLLPESMLRPSTVLEIGIGDHHLRYQAQFHFVNAHYRRLLDTDKVLHRENIYGSGPPNKIIHPDFLRLALELAGPVLDFGCGAGELVGELQRAGTEAHGLELNTVMIRRAIPPQLTSAITLYDGKFPSALEDGRFQSVVCSEVLEHITAYQAAVKEIARLTKEKAVFTVPDASAIPMGYRHGTVPWHLLEATHINFFTQQSLAEALRPHFSHIQFGRVGPSTFNDSPFFVSLVAVCLK